MTVIENTIGKIVLRATPQKIAENSEGGKLTLTYMHQGETTIRTFPVPRVIQDPYNIEAYYIFDPNVNAWR